MTRIRKHRLRWVRMAALSAGGFISLTVQAAAPVVSGQIVDLNGSPLSQAMVTIEKGAGQPGATAITVFSDAAGHFQFPAPGVAGGRVPTVKLLGYRVIDTVSKPAGEALDLTVIMRPDPNESGVAPASAWLKDIADPADRTLLVQTCIGCHQVPSPEVRGYATMIHDMPNVDPVDSRQNSWHAIVQYMNAISAWEFGRGGDTPPPDPNNVYSGGPLVATTALLARTMLGSFREVTGYHYGAPVLANAHTVIREYEIPRPNAVREALTLNDPNTIWMADVSTNRVIRVDTVTGATRALEVPSARPMDPHTLVRDKEGALWVTPFFNGIVARLDPKSEQWKTWPLKDAKVGPAAVHDLSFDVNHELVTDAAGRVWFSEIGHNGVGWFDPRSGKTQVYLIPPVPGRVGAEQTYGLAMSSDRKHIWYSQLGIGCIGSFNIETKKFETLIELPDRNAGPRRMAMSDGDILYAALFGAGQLLEYDTRAHKMIGQYDLPDRASAPYSVTWDERRKVLWIVTANADAIYRFDPRDKSFAVLPLPRERSFLRMLAIDKTTGALVTSYSNLVEYVNGPRMAVVIDLGDNPTATVAQAANAPGIPAGNSN